MAVAAAALLTASCGGASDTPVGPGASTRPAVAAPSATPSQAATPASATAAGADPAAAAGDLHAADYVLTEGPATAGFTGSPAGGSNVDSDPETQEQIAQCAGMKGYVARAPIDKATGDTFTSQDQKIDVSSSAAVVPAQQVQRDAQLVTAPAYGGCARKELAGTGYVIEVLAPPRGATALIRISSNISDGTGSIIRSVADDVVFYTGQVEVDLQIDFEKAPSGSAEQAMADQIAAKLAKQ
jgi:hypothetical protein